MLPLNFTLFFELCHFSFGERLLFAVVGGFVNSCDNPLDFYAIIISAWPAGIVKDSKIDWNIEKFCDPSLQN